MGKIFGLFDSGGMVESFNNSQSVRRSVVEATGLCLLFVLIAIVSAVINVFVVISAILERWKEIDNFTFVFCVSLSFNHFFIAFHIHSMVAYAAVANTWELHSEPCLLMGVLSTYLNSVYMLQILLLVFDMAVARYSNVRVAISVSLSKKIAFHTWIIALLPQLSPIILRTKDPYLYSAVWGGCFQTFIYRDWSTVLESMGIYLILPFGILIFWYVVLLFREESNRRLAITVSRMRAEGGSPSGRHRTTVALGVMYIATTLPYIVSSMIGMNRKDGMLAVNKFVRQMANVIFCLGSTLIPIIYIIFCPTFCRFVLPEKRYGRLYSLILRWTHPSNVVSTGPVAPSTNIDRSLNKIMEEGEEEDEDSEYIELPAVNIKLAYKDLDTRKQSPPSLRY